MPKGYHRIERSAIMGDHPDYSCSYSVRHVTGTPLYITLPSRRKPCPMVCERALVGWTPSNTTGTWSYSNMVTTISSDANRAAVAARAQRQEGEEVARQRATEEQSAGKGCARPAAALNDEAGDDVDMLSLPQSSSAAAAVAAMPKSGGAVGTAHQEDTTMEERPSHAR
jgi:hypothetical protein